jgi:hypothetical protein
MPSSRERETGCQDSSFSTWPWLEWCVRWEIWGGARERERERAAVLKRRGFEEKGEREA